MQDVHLFPKVSKILLKYLVICVNGMLERILTTRIAWTLGKLYYDGRFSSKRERRRLMEESLDITLTWALALCQTTRIDLGRDSWKLGSGWKSRWLNILRLCKRYEETNVKKKWKAGMMVKKGYLAKALKLKKHIEAEMFRCSELAR